MKKRLDQALVELGLVSTRSQAESYIKLGDARVNNNVVTKSGFLVSTDKDVIQLSTKEQYVSRAALKLASVASALDIDFNDKIVLDVGSSTGGFSEYAIKHGAKLVIAVEVGTNQLHPSLRSNTKIELHEKTDIRNFQTTHKVDIVLIDVSFISLREILPSVNRLITKQTKIVAMVKPQFEAGESNLKHKGVIKNDHIRRQILKDFESWANPLFLTQNKIDSSVSGAKGNQERFYLLQKL